jgi:tRNA 2-thiouridine synthesizing protein A
LRGGDSASADNVLLKSGAQGYFTAKKTLGGGVETRPCALNWLPGARRPPGETMHIDKEIDTRGLNCPLPILKAKKALTDMVSGQLLKVVSTDNGSLRDFQAFSKQTGNELVEQQTVGGEFVHVLRRR